jgi:F-type H+-transporting ATPase subunit gamma
MHKIIELRGKVKSISRIHNIAQAMQVMAVAELKEVQMRQRAAAHYRKHYDRLAKRLNVTVDRLTQKVRPVSLIYVLSSERGFCGAFNEQLVQAACRFLKKKEEGMKEFEMIVIGEKGCEACQAAGLKNIKKRIPNIEKMGYEQVERIAQQAYDLYRSGRVDKVLLFFNEFKSILVQAPKFLQLLPFDLSGISVSPEEPLFEPSPEKVREYVDMGYVNALFYDAFLQSRLGTIASRLLTMRGATESSKDMIKGLSIKLNKARQAMITFELSEIISSFEVLSEEG